MSRPALAVADTPPASLDGVQRLKRAAELGAAVLVRDLAEQLEIKAVEAHGYATLPGLHPEARAALNRVAASCRAEAANILRVTR